VNSMGFETLVRLVSVCSCCIYSKFPLVGGVIASKEASHCQTCHFCDRRETLKRLVASVGWGTVAEMQLQSPELCYALSPVEAERQYNRYASNYDRLDGGQASSLLGIEAARRRIIQQARGKVLEVGVGTGLNLDIYEKDQISSLTLVDISDAMLQETKVKLANLPILRNVDVRIVKGDMTSQLVELFGSESFDTVIDSFSMCVLGDNGAQKAMDQLSRVVRTQENGGQLLLLENSRSSIPILGLYQDATAVIASQVGGKGCVYNQDIGRLIRSCSRLRVVEEAEIATGLFRLFRIVRSD
jgi:methyltransferase OMS1